MRIALAAFGDRVAPRLEGAPKVLILETEEPEAPPGVGPGPAVGLGPWLGFLEQAGVRWLLCGAAGPFLQQVLAARGIRVMPGVAGEVQAVTEALREGRLRLGSAVPFSVWPGGGRGPGRCFGLGPFGARGRRRGRRFGPPGSTGPASRGPQQ